MSQSDFINYKRMYTELNITKIPSILSSHNYTLYKQFTLENIGTNKTFRTRLIPSNKIIIFDMERPKLQSMNCLQITNCKIKKL